MIALSEKVKKFTGEFLVQIKTRRTLRAHTNSVELAKLLFLWRNEIMRVRAVFTLKFEI